MCVLGSFSCWGNSLKSNQSDAISEEYKFSKGRALSLGSAMVQSPKCLLESLPKTHKLSSTSVCCVSGKMLHNDDIGHFKNLKHMKSPLSEISIAISPGLGSIKGFQTIAFPWSSYRKKTQALRN